MRRLRHLILDVLAVLILLSYLWTVQHARAGSADPTWTRLMSQRMLRVGTDPGFKPFAMEQNGVWSGYDVELMREIGRRLDVRVEFKAVSYDALYDTLAAGKVDVLASALPLAPEQGWRARFSNPYLDTGEVLVTAHASPIRDETELGGHVVAAGLGTEGDTLLRGLKHQYPSILVRSGFDTADDALRALQHGEVDAVITDAVSALGLTEADHRFTIERALSYEPVVLGLPVDAYQFQARIDGILRDLHDEGFFDHLNARWFSLPDQAEPPAQ